MNNRLKLLKWIKPPEGVFKLNIDGACNKMSKQTSGRSLIRNHHGSFLFGVCNSYGHHSVTYAELRALMDGLDLCCRKNIKPVEIETDCKELYDMVTDVAKTPGFFRSARLHILLQMSSCNASLNHVFREQNRAANYIASMRSQLVQLPRTLSLASAISTKGHHPTRNERFRLH